MELAGGVFHVCVCVSAGIKAQSSVGMNAGESLRF